jgi:RNA polymerase sigma-70 factor, ECF subfamily
MPVFEADQTAQVTHSDLITDPGTAGDVIRRAQNGDLVALRELYLAHHEQIYRFIWSRVHDPAHAEDLTGEVFLRMVANLSNYQDRSLPFRAWLYGIARNLVIDDYRKSRIRQYVPLESVAGDAVEGKSPEELTEQVLAFTRVKNALSKMAPDQREVIELRFLAGLSLNEVAAAVNKTVAAVKSLQHRGLTVLRNNLEG